MRTLTANDFDYDGGVVHIDDFTVTVRRDDWPIHPWQIGDCYPPCVHTYSSNNEISQDSPSRLLLQFFDTVSPLWCRMLGSTIAEILEVPFSAFSLDDDTRQAEFDNHLHEMTDAEKQLKMLAALYKLRGVPAFCISENGYSQGDRITALLVYSEAFRQQVGIPVDHDLEADAKACMKELHAWAFGNVYEYVIEDADAETIQQAGGYYGSLADLGHMFDDLNADLDSEIMQAQADEEERRATLHPETIQTGGLIHEAA